MMRLKQLRRRSSRLISTEEKIEITSPKEIVLTAGGSQLKINADGVFQQQVVSLKVKLGSICLLVGQQ